MEKEGCRQCNNYRIKGGCENLVGRDGSKKNCKYFTGVYPTVRIPAEKVISIPVPKNSKCGLSPELLQKLLEKQDYKCPVCNREKHLVLNHMHHSQRARGYVCRTCNTLLSGLDNSIWRERAERFIDNPPAESLYDDPLYESQIKFG